MKTQAIGSATDTDIHPDGLLMELDETVREKLIAAGRFETKTAGTFIAKQGQLHDAFSVILLGKVAVFCHSRDDTVELVELTAGDVMGEMSMIEESHVSSADIVVKESPTRIWTIDGDAFDTFVTNDPHMGFKVMKLLARELCQLVRHNTKSLLTKAEALRMHYLDMDY